MAAFLLPVILPWLFMNYRQLRIPIILLFVLLLGACSATQQAYIQNFKLYFDGQEGVELTEQEIINSPIDLLYVKNGDRPYATMALAFIENEQYKWLSKDDVMFITQKGRLVQTLGLSENLIYLSNADEDYLNNWLEKSAVKRRWNRTIDTQLEGRSDYGAKLSSSMQLNKNVEIMIQNKAYSTHHIVETVSYESVLYGKGSWVNEFWFGSESQQLLKSVQIISPQMDSVEIIYVSRALRLKTAKTEISMLNASGVNE